MNEETLVLRVGIEGRWEAAEFAKSLSALDQLYLTRFALTLEHEELRELRDFYMEGPFGPMPYLHSSRSLRRWLKAAPPAVFRRERQLEILGGPADAGPAIAELLEGHERLLVQRVIYGSPRIKDLVGVGEIVGHLKDMLVRLIDHCSTRRQRNLENDRRELENRKLELEVAKEFVALARDIGYTKREMRQLVAKTVEQQQPLVRLITAGKIVSADTLEGDLEKG